MWYAFHDMILSIQTDNVWLSSRQIYLKTNSGGILKVDLLCVVVYIISPFIEAVVAVVIAIVFSTVVGSNVGSNVVSMPSFSEIMRFYFL